MEKKKKNRFWIAGTAVVLGTVLFCSGMQVGAATNEPGSAGDPLITRSYLEAELAGTSGSYQCITLKKGEALSLNQGAEVVLYTGTATIKGNLIDTTAGSLAGNGTAVEKYHAYLVPADGSGFTAGSTCVIFLSGKKN